jgi:hypothetical protein
MQSPPNRQTGKPAYGPTGKRENRLTDSHLFEHFGGYVRDLRIKIAG